MSTADKPTADDRDDQIEDAEIVDEAHDGESEAEQDGAGVPGEEDTSASEDVDEGGNDESEPDSSGNDGAEADHDDAENAASDPGDEAENAAPAVERPLAESIAAVPPAPMVVPRIRKGPGFFTMLFGGILAGAAGYVLAYATEFRPLSSLIGGFDPRTEIVSLNARLKTQGDDLKEAAQAAQAAEEAATAAEAKAGAATDAAAAAAGQASQVADQLAGLQEKVVALTPGTDDIPPAVLDQLRSAALEKVAALDARVAAAETTLQEMRSRVSDLSAQIEALGGVQAAATDQQLSAYETQLAALQAELDAQRAAIAEAQTHTQEMTAAAEAQQRAMLAEAALARVRAAVSGGGAFDGALSELAASSDVEIPAILKEVAKSGVRTLPQLQDSFPAAARAGLSAAIAAEAGTGSAMDRLGKFLRVQTGARSLTEREGDDPDAVLSRVEARLMAGDLTAALDELSTLNAAGQDAMADWIADARARADALAAVDKLSAALAAE